MNMIEKLQQFGNELNGLNAEGNNVLQYALERLLEMASEVAKAMKENGNGEE